MFSHLRPDHLHAPGSATEREDRDSNKSLTARLRDQAGFSVNVLAEVLIPTSEESARASTRSWRRFCIGFWSFIRYLPLAILIACLVWHLCEWAEHWLDPSPHVNSLANIAGGILLVFGALLIAWNEKNLTSEYAYQYDTMATLFRAADRQMTAELAALAKPGADAEEHIRQIQAMLYKLGQQALDENAEWLLLHRARPLEPVMAG